MASSGSFLDNTFKKLLFAYVFITVLLPSGSVYGFNFKYPLYLGLLPLSFYIFFKRKNLYLKLTLICTVLGVIGAWTCLGLLYGFNALSVLRQAMDILLTFLLCWLVSLFCGSDESKQLSYLRLVVNAVTATAGLKLGVIAYALARGIPVATIIPMLNHIFGVELITMDLGTLLGRFQFVSDELIPVAVFIVLRHRDRLRIGSARASIMILLMTASVIFSFSRYFWGFTAFAFLTGLLLGKRDKFQFILVSVLGLSFAVSLPTLIDLYNLRFSIGVTGDSDDLRLDQTRALKEAFFEAPLFGRGLGSYSGEVIRGDTKLDRFSYEVQLLALSTQIGLVGFSLLFALAAFYYRGLWLNRELTIVDRIGVGLLLAFWIAAGLTNPLLFSPVAGVNYAAIAVLTGISTKPFQLPTQLLSARKHAVRSGLRQLGSAYDLRRP